MASEVANENDPQDTEFSRQVFRETLSQEASNELTIVRSPTVPRRPVVAVLGVAVLIIVAVVLLATLAPKYMSSQGEAEKIKSKEEVLKEDKGSVLSSHGQSVELKSSVEVRSTLHHVKPSPSLTLASSGTTNDSSGVSSSTEQLEMSSSGTTSDFKRISSSSSQPQKTSSGANGNFSGVSSSTVQPQMSSSATTNDFSEISSYDVQLQMSFSVATGAFSRISIIVTPPASQSDGYNCSATITTTKSTAAAGLSSIARLVPNLEAKWSRWSHWSDCTKTCGGGARVRTRICKAQNQRAVFAPISCAGKPHQNKTCASWSCPDCSRVCTTGTLNAACDACTCAHHVLTGRVLTKSGVPLSEANISLAETPYNVLAQTNVSGFFSASGVCADSQQELFVCRVGYVPLRIKMTVLTPTTATIKVKMENAVPPSVTVHPQNKMKMSGQNAIFCCDGEGNPPPEIEWFKENNIIDESLYSYNNTLQIADVRGLNGSYRCRVVNDFGSEFSDAAELEVVEQTNDTCNSKPTSKNVTLPPGCVLEGTNTSIVDVGECAPVACLKKDYSLNSSCQDPSFCCGPHSFSEMLIRCAGVMTLNISIVTKCACANCTEKSASLQGIVVGGPEEKPVKYGDVIYAGKVVAYTDEEGRFAFTIPGNVKRAIVTFKDYAFEEFEETDKVFVLTEGQVAFYKIKLRKPAPPIDFNASKPIDIPLESDPGAGSFAELELPEEALLTQDGSVFRGNAKAKVTVFNPRNLTDVLSAPGDFTTVDEDGEENILETFGLMRLGFEDDKGNKLAMSKVMKVYLDPEKLNMTIQEGSNLSAKLYWLDKNTGRWIEAGDFLAEDGSKRRRRRSNRVFLVADVTPAIQLESLNFDWPHVRVAVRVTTPKGGSIVRVIRQDYGGYAERTTGASGVACIPIWRNTECYLQAEHDGKYLVPTGVNALPGYISATIAPNTGSPPPTPGSTTITIKFFYFKSKLEENNSLKSPLYKHIDSEEKRCKSLSKLEAGNQFSFTQDKNTLPDYSLFYKNPNLNWNLVRDRFECFIKVKITGINAVFVAESHKESDPKETGKYGYHMKMSTTVPGGDHMVCLRFRCSSTTDYTYVMVAPLTRKTCVLKEVDKTLNSVQYPNIIPKGTKTRCAQAPSKRKGEEKWLCIPRHKSNTNYYQTFIGVTKKEGKDRCMQGDQKHVGKVTANADGWALTYDCR